jgi:hypothetical protein
MVHLVDTKQLNRSVSVFGRDQSPNMPADYRTYIVNQGGKDTSELGERVRIDAIRVIMKRPNDILSSTSSSAIPAIVEQNIRWGNDARQQLRHTHCHVRSLKQDEQLRKLVLGARCDEADVILQNLSRCCVHVQSCGRDFPDTSKRSCTGGDYIQLRQRDDFDYFVNNCGPRLLSHQFHRRVFLTRFGDRGLVSGPIASDDLL